MIKHTLTTPIPLLTKISLPLTTPHHLHLSSLSKFEPKPKPKKIISTEHAALAKKQCCKCQGLDHISRDYPQIINIPPKYHRTHVNFLAQQKEGEERACLIRRGSGDETKEGESHLEDDEKWDDQETQAATLDKDTLILRRLLRAQASPLEE